MTPLNVKGESGSRAGNVAFPTFSLEWNLAARACAKLRSGGRMRRAILLLAAAVVCTAQEPDKKKATSEGQYGAISTERREYRPLDSVKVEIGGSGCPGQSAPG